MPSPLEEIRAAKSKQKTPWTVLSDGYGVSGIDSPKEENNLNVVTTLKQVKNTNFLPIVFAAFTFMLIFIVSNNFGDMSADLFNSWGEGDNVRFWLKLNNDFNNLTGNTGTTVPAGWNDDSVNVDSSTGETLIEIEDDNAVITNPQAVDVTPVENAVSPQNNILPVENPHKSASVENPIEATIIPISPSKTTQTAFRINTHTYDKIWQSQISDDLEILTLENLHDSAPENNTNISSAKNTNNYIPVAKENIQSGPEEVIVFLSSFLISTCFWFYMRRVRSKQET